MKMLFSIKFIFLASFFHLFSLTIVNSSPTEKYVLDSTTFQSELNWDHKEFGMSLELPGWKEQSFSQKNGDVWRVHFVCDISSSNPDNWLRLPFIQRDKANRFIIRLEYTIRECKKYPGEIRSCKETFQLLYTEANQNEQAPPFSESNYKYLKTIAPNSASSNSLSSSYLTTSTASTSISSNIFRTEVDLPLSGDKNGVYIVFRDQGACVSLLAIKVFYTLCPTEVINLISFPSTPTGSNMTDLVRRVGKCIENAESNSTPYGYCQTNGNWFITNDNTCSCKAGYFYSNNKCLECPQGEYKSLSSNDPKCLQCPENSWTSKTASQNCACLDGHYRIDPNNLSSMCIPYPSEPKNITVYYLDQTSLKLRWNSVNKHEFNSVRYKLECYKCVQRSEQSKKQLNSTASSLATHSSYISTEIRQNSMCTERELCESYVKVDPDKNAIYTNRVALSGLDSGTQYLIEVYAEHVNGTFKTRTVDIMAQTNEAIKELAIENTTAYQFNELNQIFLLWSKPKLLTHNVLSYEIRYWPGNDLKKASLITLIGSISNYTMKNLEPSLFSSASNYNELFYTFQIRCETAIGWGPYSRPAHSVKLSSKYTTNSYSSSLVYEQFKQKLKGSSSDSGENLPIYISISISISLCILIATLTTIILLARSGKVKFLLSNQSSRTSSDCDPIDIAKKNALMAYNQLGTVSSDGSSPTWPPSGKTYIDPHTYEDPTKVVNLFARELMPSNIIIESVIGGGEFGDVCKGVLKLDAWTQSIVAIKTLKGAATEQNRCDFLTEASIMAQFHDPNVIRLEGVVTLSHPLMIVTEYMENGSLDSFLRLNEYKLNVTQMVRILRDVASGMRYLSDMNYIHRDLAARNILVNKDLVCKVADFGLSREIDNDSFEYTTRGGKIPIRWTAPEACNFRKYTCASDVWSFGVLSWEVLTFGERPYWSWENKDVIRAVQELYRLPPPDKCADSLYKLMLMCWQENRTLRPRFHDIVVLLDDIIKHPEKLREQTKIREMMPISHRAPTKIQLTKTKQFLLRLNLEQYAENFEKHHLGNLSNLFQLDAKYLSLVIGVHSPIDQKRILDELKLIYELFSKNNSLNFNPYNTMLNEQKKHLQQLQQQSHHTNHQQSSIFDLIRGANSNVEATTCIETFSAKPIQPSFSNNNNNSNSLANGFLV